jgi:hypothetical protein
LCHHKRLQTHYKKLQTPSPPHPKKKKIKIKKNIYIYYEKKKLFPKNPMIQMIYKIWRNSKPKWGNF